VARGQTLSFQKLVATGNDFVFVDARTPMAPAFAATTRSELAKKICDRHLGAGADGLVFLESSGPRLKWDFYNNDGSSAEMCGNASRCVGRWAERQLGVDSVELETAPGLVRIAVAGQEIVSHIDYLHVDFSALEYEVGGRTKTATLVNTGVPHVVVELARIEDAVTSLADIRSLRFHPGAGTRGANVTFLSLTSTSEFNTVTFERGVEGFTLSCGTGVLAAAAVGLRKAQANGGAQMSAALVTPGGRLRVGFGSDWSGATLQGPARFLYEGVLNEEFLK
jgi:diaminopimelate epimerase